MVRASLVFAHLRGSPFCSGLSAERFLRVAEHRERVGACSNLPFHRAAALARTPASRKLRGEMSGLSFGLAFAALMKSAALWLRGQLRRLQALPVRKACAERHSVFATPRNRLIFKKQLAAAPQHVRAPRRWTSAHPGFSPLGFRPSHGCRCATEAEPRRPSDLAPAARGEQPL